MENANDNNDQESQVIIGRVGTGYNILFLSPAFYAQALNLMMKAYIGQDIICTLSGIKNDSDSLQSLEEKILKILKNNNSLIVIDTKKLDPVGVLLLTVVEKLDFGRTISLENIQKGNSYCKMVKLDNLLIRKHDFYVEYDCKKFLRIHLLCVQKEHRGKKLGYNLIRSAFHIAELLKIRIIVGTFPTYRYQQLAKTLGFSEIEAVTYEDCSFFNSDSELRNKSNNVDTTCALMVAELKQTKIDVKKIVKESDKKARKK